MTLSTVSASPVSMSEVYLAIADGGWRWSEQMDREPALVSPDGLRFVVRPHGQQWLAHPVRDIGAARIKDP